MALSFSNLTNDGATSATSFATASVSPAGDRLILVTVHGYVTAGSAQPPQPTVTGNGITYELVRAQDTDTAGGDRATMWVFRGMDAAPSAGAITIDFGATTVNRCQWSVDQSSAEVDTSGTNGSGAIVAANVTGSTPGVGTSLSINYPQAMVAGNAGFAAFGHLASEAATERTNWTELADITAVTLSSLEVQYISGTDTAGSASWATSSRSGGIIIEVAAAAGDATVTPDVIACTADLPAVAVSVGASPSPVAAVAALPQTAVSVGASPSPVAAVAALPQTAVSVGAAPAVLATVVALPLAVAGESGAGDETVTPSVIAAVAALPAPSVSVGAAPSPVAATATLPQPTVSVGVASAVLAVLAALPQATVRIDHTVTPAVVALVVALAQPTVSVGVTPAVIAALVALPAPESVGSFIANINAATAAVIGGTTGRVGVAIVGEVT